MVQLTLSPCLRGHTQRFSFIVAVVSFLLLEKCCQGVYQEYNVMEQCEKEIDLTGDSAIAGKLTLSTNTEQTNCTVTLEPWFAWKRTAFELKDYNLGDGACISVEQVPRYRFDKETIGTLLEICQRGSDTEVTGNHTSTDGFKNLIIKYTTPDAGLKSRFVLRFFGFSDRLPCDAVLCDEDKCLTTVLLCKSYYLYGHCADVTRCHRPKPPEEKPFKLSTAQIIGIVGACLSLPSFIYFLYRCCCKKKRETSELPLESPYPADSAADDQSGETALSEPGKPLPSAPPPSYNDVMTGDSKDPNTEKIVI